MVTLEHLLFLYSCYLHFKAMGMLSGRLGDKEAMRRMSEIDRGLKALGMTRKELKKLIDKK